jgi:SAM-dependent methyltransferase
MKEIEAAVRAAYERIGREGSRAPGGLPFPTGVALARVLGYPEEVLGRLPEPALASFVGAAPLPREVLTDRPAGSRPGEWVVDGGCGAGVDAIWLASAGLRVAAFDPCPAMLARLRDAAGRRVHLLRAGFPEIPLRSASASHVLSNGVANLIPDKGSLAREVFRVLAPCGKWLVADVLALGEVDSSLRADPDAWAFCVGGALTPDGWRALCAEAGFASAEVEVLESFPPLGRGVVRAARK